MGSINGYVRQKDTQLGHEYTREEYLQYLKDCRKKCTSMPGPKIHKIKYFDDLISDCKKRIQLEKENSKKKFQ